MAVLIDLINEVLGTQLLGLTVTTSGVSGGTYADYSDANDALGAYVAVASTTIPQTTAITSFNLQIQECSTTNGTYTLIPGMSCTVTSTTAVTNLLQVMRGLRTSQYIQCSVVTATGGTISLPFAVIAVGQKKFMQGVGVTGGGYSRYPSS
jgi:hypothetical protein